MVKTHQVIKKSYNKFDFRSCSFSCNWLFVFGMAVVRRNAEGKAR